MRTLLTKVMNVLQSIPQGWRRRLLLAGCACLLVALGAAGGAWFHPRTVRVTEYKDRIQTVEHVVTVEKPVDRWHDRVVERIVYRKDGSKSSETTTTETGGSRTGGSTTVTDTRVDESRSGHESVVTAPEGRWSVRVLAGANTLGGVVAGAGAEYRLVGPLTVGAWATGPVAGASSGFTVGLSLGLRL